jgi:hypothetical protein
MRQAEFQMNEGLSSLNESALALAKQLLPGNERKQQQVADYWVALCEKSINCDILVIHSPGGWGSALLKDLIDWEYSIVDGVGKSLNDAGVKWEIVQYLRSSNNAWDHFLHFPEQIWYGVTGKIRQAYIVAAGLEFIRAHSKNLKILLLGASQGAAFDNTVMKHLADRNNIFSIELGTFFMHLTRRKITENTLAIDSNGLVPDPVVHWNFGKALSAYITAPFRWIKYRMAGESVKFTYCINVPGHEYRWEYLHVQSQIIKFIKTKIVEKSSIVGGYKR